MFASVYTVLENKDLLRLLFPHLMFTDIIPCTPAMPLDVQQSGSIQFYNEKCFQFLFTALAFSLWYSFYRTSYASAVLTDVVEDAFHLMISILMVVGGGGCFVCTS